MIGQEFREYLTRVANQHKGLVDVSVEQSSANLKRPVTKGGIQVGEEDYPNPSPIYHYEFGDGTYLRARDTSGPGESGSSYAIIGQTAGLEEPKADKGTIPKSVKFRATAGMSKESLSQYEQDLVDAGNDPNISAADRAMVQAELGRVRDDMRAIKDPALPKGQGWQSVYFPGTDVLMGMQDSAGNYRDATDSERRLLSKVGVGSSVPGVGGGGSTRTEFPSETALRNAQTQETLARAGAVPSEIASREASASYTRTLQDKARQEMLGKQQVALQQYYDSIQSLQDMLAKGSIKPAEADAYMGLFKQNLDASLRGATPFDEEKLKSEQTTQRGQIGRDLLNQRLSSSTTMANALIGLLGTAGGKATESFKFDPFAMAKSFTGDVGGGEATSSLAQQLLQGMAPQGATPAAAPGQAAIPADVPPDLADVYRQVKALAPAGGA